MNTVYVFWNDNYTTDWISSNSNNNNNNGDDDGDDDDALTAKNEAVLKVSEHLLYCRTFSVTNSTNIRLSTVITNNVCVAWPSLLLLCMSYYWLFLNFCTFIQNSRPCSWVFRQFFPLFIRGGKFLTGDLTNIIASKLWSRWWLASFFS